MSPNPNRSSSSSAGAANATSNRSKHTMTSIPPNITSKRIRRILSQRLPQTIENDKKLLCITGSTHNVSEICYDAMTDFSRLHQPSKGRILNKKNSATNYLTSQLFTDQRGIDTIEFLCDRNDSSLCIIGTHSKRRPHTLICTRTHDKQLLDAIEFTIRSDTFISMNDMQALKQRKATVRIGSQPLLIFQGQGWESQNNTITSSSPSSYDSSTNMSDSNNQHIDSDMSAIRSYFIDLFHGDPHEDNSINLASLDHCIIFTSTMYNGKPSISMRHYGVLLKKSAENSRHPRVELDEVGPRIDMIYTGRRIRGSTELYSSAMQQSRVLNTTLAKNIEAGVLGDSMGRLHMGQQDIHSIALRKPKGQRKRNRIESQMPDIDDKTYEAEQADRQASKGNWRKQKVAHDQE